MKINSAWHKKNILSMPSTLAERVLWHEEHLKHCRCRKDVPPTILAEFKKQGKKMCSRGHIFHKSSDCPVCPKCWSGYYKKKNVHDFPEKIGAPALRALLNTKITSLKQVKNYSEKELLKLHGLGPKAIKLLKVEMEKKRISFKVTD